MKFFLWYIEKHDYKAQNLSFSEEIERLKAENKKLSSENYALKCRTLSLFLINLKKEEFMTEEQALAFILKKQKKEDTKDGN